MMNHQPILKDERYVAVENASYRVGYIIMTFGLLLDVTLRGFINMQDNWDLLALVILSGLATTGYQAYYRIIPRSWLYGPVLIAVAVAAVTAVVVVLIRNFIF